MELKTVTIVLYSSLRVHATHGCVTFTNGGPEGGMGGPLKESQ
jgi:hypothetical protein